MNERLPARHDDPRIEITRPYITSVVQALQMRGINIERSWLDPYKPRDATVVLVPIEKAGVSVQRALVWDEDTGWRIGTLRSGQQGVRTVLAEEKWLGGGVLLSGEAVAQRVREDVPGQREVYRRHQDTNDGFEDSLKQFSREARILTP